MKRDKVCDALREQLAIATALIASMQETIRTFTYKEQFWHADRDRMERELQALRLKKV